MDCPTGALSFNGVSLVQLVVIASTLLLVALIHPTVVVPLEQADGGRNADDPPEANEEAVADGKPLSARESGTTSKRVLLLCGCVILDVLRAYCISGVEFSTEAILQQRRHWRLRFAGLAVGCVFLAILPAVVLHQSLGTRLRETMWIRIYLAIALVGCVMLRENTAKSLHSPPGWSLIFADVILLPSLYMCGALTIGILLQHVLPPGSLLDANNLNVVRIMLAQGVAHWLGPGVGRWVVESSGQDVYALYQAGLCLVMWLVFEAIVHPRMEYD